LQYTGHGATNRWFHDNGIWTVADAAGLHNSPRYPILMSFNCLDGFFDHPLLNMPAMAEVFQRQPGGGSVAAISPSGLSLSGDVAELRKFLMQLIFQEGVRDLGRALTLAKQRYNATYPGAGGPAYLLYTMTLFGDPAMQVPAVGISDLKAAKSGSNTLLTWTHLDSKVTRYAVWRSANAYFTPGDSGSQNRGDAILPGSGTQASFQDTGALGGPAHGYFYQVVPMIASGIAYPASNRAGMFSLALVPGAP
jgi:hypothetical protein